MKPEWILIGISAYFVMLLLIGRITGKNADSNSYFLGNKQSIWWMVALGMLSDSMSGVSFISVPGAVSVTHWHYFQLVIGYFFGYLVIAFVLLPLYYRYELTSIYSYLETRFNASAQKTGAFFFIISRLLGSAGRLFLAVAILQIFLFDYWQIPFPISVALIILLILAYTLKGGIRTLVITDAVQSVFLIGGLVIAVYSMLQSPSLSAFSLGEIFERSAHTELINADPMSATFWAKHFLGGMFICIAMTGLDQNMMQKNLSLRTLKDAQKNMIATAFVVVAVNAVFLSLGVIMVAYLQETPELIAVLTGKSDLYFPSIAFHLGGLAGMAFVLGLAAATFSSADSVLTTLTTSTYFDLLGINKRNWSEPKKAKVRNLLHALFAVLLLLTILGFDKFAEGAIIDVVLGLANYTYGPLIGLFALGIYTNRKPSAVGIVSVSLIVPLFCWYLGKNVYVSELLGLTPLTWSYNFGFELIVLNGLLSFIGFWIFSKSGRTTNQPA
jgi:Na+/proline symporter